MSKDLDGLDTCLETLHICEFDFECHWAEAKHEGPHLWRGMMGEKMVEMVWVTVEVVSQ